MIEVSDGRVPFEVGEQLAALLARLQMPFGNRSAEVFDDGLNRSKRAPCDGGAFLLFRFHYAASESPGNSTSRSRSRSYHSSHAQSSHRASSSASTASKTTPRFLHFS